MKTILLRLGMTAFILGIINAFTGTALAYRGDPGVKGPNYSIERHQVMEKAFENKDYDVWKNLMQGRGRVTQVINKDNFAKFAEAHNLTKQGKLAEAQKIRQELGLWMKNGSKQGMNTNRGLNR